MSHAPRACPVCCSEPRRVLFRQQFGELSEGSLLTHYDVVSCNTCGAAYADDIPEQAHFDRYYGEMSKYEYADNSGVQSPSYLQNYRDIVDLLAAHAPPGASVLDVGCATGGLLAELQRRGYTNLFGVDPSPSAARAVTRLHGVPARCLTIGQLGDMSEQFDAVLLTGVLEHLPDVDHSLQRVLDRVRPGGLLFLVVPDATRYDQHDGAPFQFFSMEHVNYFGPQSLGLLLARHGGSCVFAERLPLRLGPKAIEPSIGALFKVSAQPALNVSDRDNETEPALLRYIERSAALETRILAKIAALADGGRPLAVWGTGTHTLRLMRTSRLPEARIVAFLDSNPNYQGKTLAGVPVIAPAALDRPDVEVLISSQTAEDEIYSAITHQLRWPNPVHRLYTPA